VHTLPAETITCLLLLLWAQVAHAPPLELARALQLKAGEAVQLKAHFDGTATSTRRRPHSAPRVRYTWRARGRGEGLL
jgi:hypothetical protein